MIPLILINSISFVDRLEIYIILFLWKAKYIQRGGGWFPQTDGHWSRDAVPGIDVSLAFVGGMSS